MIKHFGGHTDVCFAKSLRTDADHNGKSQHRLNTHNGHFGMRSVNKSSLSFFPFKFMPMDSALTPPNLRAGHSPRRLNAIARVRAGALSYLVQLPAQASSSSAPRRRDAMHDSDE